MKKLLVAGLFVLALAGCNTTSNSNNGSGSVHAGYNFTSPVPAGHSSAAVKRAIIKTGQARRWIIKEVRPNTLLATQMANNGIRADVEITYNASSYSFYLKNSTGLRQTPTRVHSRYTNWVRIWDTDIQRTLLTKNYR